MIIHVFNLKMKGFRLNLSVIKSMVKLYGQDIPEKTKPYFLCYGPFVDIAHRQEYEKWFAQLGCPDYCFCETEKDLRRFVHAHKEESYLLHGVTYQCMFHLIRFRVENINWVCWGQGASTNWRNWRSVVSIPIKLWMYHHFRSTIVLLPGDKETLEGDFGLKRITCLPYYSGEQEQLQATYDKLLISCPANAKPVVYLGNNGHHMRQYAEWLKRLECFAGRIEIHCMLQYGPVGQEDLQQEVVALGHALYGDDFYPDTDYMVDRNEYLQYMNKCDVYICPAESQSGLGAIYNSLVLGKKVYITGKNYEHISNLKFKVFELSSLDDRFTEPLDTKERIQNYHLYLSRQEPLRKGWVKYLEEL